MSLVDLSHSSVRSGVRGEFCSVAFPGVWRKCRSWSWIVVSSQLFWSSDVGELEEEQLAPRCAWSIVVHLGSVYSDTKVLTYNSDFRGVIRRSQNVEMVRLKPTENKRRRDALPNDSFDEAIGHRQAI